MRKEHSIYNSIAGIINRLISILFIFIVRHYFALYLNNEFIGLEGLFSNILGLFSLVDLGLGNAITFNLYEPIHNNDRDTISAIMSLYKKLYLFIGAVIFALACIISPFIPQIIKDTTIRKGSIRLFFLVYAFGVAVTYLFSYKRTLMFALQKNYKVLNVDTISKFLLSIFQIIALVYYKNYLLYLALIVIINLTGNIVISIILNKENQYDQKSKIVLPQDFKTKLKSHVKVLAITNIAWQGIASTDNIIISAIVGVLDLAKNANYSMISNSINSIISVVLGGASASIGDMLVEKNAGKSIAYFDRYCFIHTFVSSYAALGVYFVSDPVIKLWVGEQLLFDHFTVLMLALNIFLILNFRPLADFQNYSGTFVYYKSYSVVALVINIVTSVTLGRVLGISGIFIGTTLTYVFMIFAVTRILSNHLFKKSSVRYIKKMFINCTPLAFSFFLIYLMVKAIPLNNLLLEIVVHTVIVTFTYISVFSLLLWRNKEFKYFKDLSFKIIKNKSLKNL